MTARAAPPDPPDDQEDVHVDRDARTSPPGQGTADHVPEDLVDGERRQTPLRRAGHRY